MQIPVPSPSQQDAELAHELEVLTLALTPSPAVLALRVVLTERIRQVRAGYTAEHDVEHGDGYLVLEAQARMDVLGEGGPITTSELAEIAALLVAAIEVQIYTEGA